MKNIKSINDFLNESIEDIQDIKNIKIEIIKEDIGKYSVNYQITIDGNDIEIEGNLNSYNSGRAEEYKFEVDTFIHEEDEEYYNNNWEDIEDQILTYFWENKRIIDRK